MVNNTYIYIIIIYNHITIVYIYNNHIYIYLINTIIFIYSMVYPLVSIHKKNYGKSPFLMGKSTN